jgi:DUF971 family protein
MTSDNDVAVPVGLQRDDQGRLLIDWSDGQRRRYTARALRDACPCATCREKKRQPVDPLALPILSPANAQPLRIADMQPVGNYAYGIAFNDGHDTGIYSLDLLRQLGEVVE